MPKIGVDLDNTVVISDGIDFTVNLTLRWTQPFANFDPIQNYTIVIACTSGGCPVILTTDNFTVTMDISYITRVNNVTIMVTANNTVGDSDAGVLEVVGKL